MAIVTSSVSSSAVPLSSIIYRALESSFLRRSPVVSVSTDVSAAAEIPTAPSPSRSACSTVLPNKDS
jgi:hypothetical protein